MSVLTADRETARKEGGVKSYLMGTDIIYKGGFVAINEEGRAVAFPVAASAVGLRFAGVAMERVDNSIGAGTKWVKVYTKGEFLFTASSITQAMTGEMMFAVDDNIFDDEPGTYGIPVGILVEYVSTTSGWIDITPAVNIQRNPKSPLDFITKTANYTVLVTDSGAKFATATDAMVFTLPSTAKGLTYQFWNTGADAAVLLSVSPVVADRIRGGGIAGGIDNKDYQNTKVSAKMYDMLEIVGDGVDGWIVTQSKGTWVAEA